MSIQQLMCVVFFLIALALVEQAIGIQSTDDEWDYGAKGPKTGAWCKVSAVCCSGKRQSPVLLDNISLQKMTTHTAPLFYNREIKLVGTNNGKTVIFSVKPKPAFRPSLKPNELQSRYVFQEIHFHWGTRNDTGAEHKTSNVTFPMEVQLVHYKQSFKKYQMALESGETDALAIISVLYSFNSTVLFNQLHEEVESVFKNEQKGIGLIADSLLNISEPGKTTTVSIKLKDLLPKMWSYKEQTFRYSGSLTTPPCSEIVIWNVLDSPLSITIGQIEEFRKLKGKGNINLSNNFRTL